MLCMLLIASCAIYGQSTPTVTYTVKGTLIDSLTLESEPYATIKIVRKDTPANAVKMAVTNNNGKFEEKITGSGHYIMTITSIGKVTVVKEFALQPEQRVLDLGTLHTADAANELKGVEIVAQKPLVKVDLDKIEYNIEDDPDSKTNSVLEMLRKVPLVTVDGEDNIEVNGSSSFKVHVNGKPNNMMSDNPTEVLKSMPANTIKHIEVITNPGAKYDAEGVGGILNIVTVSGAGVEGYTATFTGNASNTGAGGSIYATVKKDKLTLTGRYGYNYNDRPRSYSNNMREDWKDDRVTLYDNNMSKSKGGFQQGSLEASYELDTLRLITMSFGMYGNDSDMDGEGQRWLNDAAGNRIYAYNTASSSDNSWFSIRGNVDYQRSFSVKDRLLTFSYNINSRPQDSDSYIDNTLSEDTDPSWMDLLRLDNTHADGEQNTMEHTFQIDYTTPIGKLHTIETGMKYIIRNNTSDNDLYVRGAGGYQLDEDRSSHYKHLNDILAAYGGYSIRYKKFSGKTGVRYERTMQDVKYRNQPDRNFDADFNDVVPSVTVGLKVGKTQNLRVGYNMRIWRPSIYFLNPYYDDSNPTSVRQGNPNLESEKNHSFNLNYSNFTAKFNLNLSFNHSFTNNGIEQITELRTTELGNNYTYRTFENIGRTRYTGLRGYANWNASPKTRIYINASTNYSVLKSPAQGLKNEGWNAFAYGGIQHTLPLDLRVSLNVMGATPYMTLQGRGTSFHDYSMSVNRSFLDKRLTLSAFAGNIFKKYQSSSSNVEGADFTMRTEQRYSRQRYGMSVSYRIGDLKAGVKKAARTINNDDEKGGESGGGGEGGGN